MRILFGILMMFYGISALADLELSLIRKVAVFPIADSQTAMSEDSWWQMRELLTKDQRYLVASRRFMINRGVFQPRKSLKPADVIILGKILDAQALVTTWIEDRTMKMRIYEGENGYLLWESEIQFHPAISKNDQILKLSVKLMSDFIASIPYHAYQIIDEVIGKAVYEKDTKKYAQIFLGSNSGVQVGDVAQWIEVTGDISQPYFNAAKITIIAEGTVVRIKDQRAEVEILKLTDTADLKENSLVRFPKEVTRLKEMYSPDDKGASLSAEYLSSEIKEAAQVNKDTHSTTTALAFIFNIAGMLLLAF